MKEKYSKNLTLVERVNKLVHLGGLWVGSEGNKVHICAKFAIFSFLSVYVLQIIALLIAKDDPERLFECFSVISFCGMGILKLYSMQRNRIVWQRLLNRMTELESITTTEFNANGYKFVEIYPNKFKKISTTLYIIYRFTAVVYILSPFVEYSLFWLLDDKPEEYPHILPNWNPFPKKNIVFYIMMIIFESIAAIYCVAMHIGFDCAAIGVMIFLTDQFSALSLECSFIAGNGEQLIPTAGTDAVAHSRIVRSHKKHMFLTKSIKDLDYLLGNTLGVYIFLSTLTLCSVSVRITSEEMSVMQLISLFQYMCSTLIQLFLYCSYGHDVQNESSVSLGPLSAAHWCVGPATRRELALLGFGLMLPRRIHAGPYHMLNLATFIQIVRTAYSCYALLGKVNSS